MRSYIPYGVSPAVLFLGGRLLMRTRFAQSRCIKPSGPWRTSGGGCRRLASASLSDIAIKRLPSQQVRRIMSLVALFL